MKPCTRDQWADYVSDFRTYQTEYKYGKHFVMYSKLSQGSNVGKEIAEVHYCEDGTKLYFILSNKKYKFGFPMFLEGCPVTTETYFNNQGILIYRAIVWNKDGEFLPGGVYPILLTP